MNKRQRKKLEAKKKLKLANVPHFTSVERWNLFHTFSVYIAAGLKDFLSHNICSIPCAFSDEDHPFDVEKATLNGETGEKAWRGTIEKMLWSFEQLRDDCPDSPFNKWEDKQFWSLIDSGILPMEISEEPDENGLRAVKINGEETPQEIWDADKLYHQKIQEGIDLFAKYFRDLWD